MIVIGERINGLFKDVAKAIKGKDKAIIQKWAKEQTESGATFLDVNTGPASAEPAAAMKWLVETIREVCDTPLAIDSPKPEVLEAGLAADKNGRALINSTTAQKEKLDAILPLAAKYNAQVIGLTMDEKGIPRDAQGRTELALQIIAAAMEKGIATDNLYIDPLILPVNVAQFHCPEVLEAIKNIKLLADPAPKVILGLSNVSQGTDFRPLINRTYLVMAMACGLDGAIVDACDRDLRDAFLTAEILLNKTVYCDSYLKA